MTDRPIIFSAPMVRALLAGIKTQTRRLATSPLRRCEVGDRLWVREAWRIAPDACEGWNPNDNRPSGWIDYRAGGDAKLSAPSFSHLLDAFGLKVDVDWDFVPDTWRPSLFMPRWASRLTLTVEAVRIEPLQAMEGQHPAESDAIAEGVRAIHHGDGDYYYHAFRDEPHPKNWIDPADAYRELWESLHDKPGQHWEDNPEIVALTFRCEQRNIDA